MIGVLQSKNFEWNYITIRLLRHNCYVIVCGVTASRNDDLIIHKKADVILPLSKSKHGTAYIFCVTLKEWFPISLKLACMKFFRLGKKIPFEKLTPPILLIINNTVFT